MSTVESPAYVSALKKLANNVTVVKRNGDRVQYDNDRVFEAIYSCFNRSCNHPPKESAITAAIVSRAVYVTLSDHQGLLSVETIQDTVEKQLMELGYLDEAKAYILYREEHRKLRNNKREVPQEVVDAFNYSQGMFTGPNARVQMFQALDKTARFNHDLNRRETWAETVDRVINFTRKRVTTHNPGAIPDYIFLKLKVDLLNLRSGPSMRMIQMAGPALDRCEVGVYNCAFQAIQNTVDLAEELYVLMQGTGAGFTVERKISIEHWPEVQQQRGLPPTQFKIEDTTESWCESYRIGLDHWINGDDIEFDYSAIRPEGTILKTKGGRASGPQPLMDLHSFARAVILSKQGERLKSLDIHDINCFAHRIVQMGGVRRASGISISDLDDVEMRHCKDGQFWNTHKQRNQANNSAAYDKKPTAIEFMEEWLSLAKSGSGERGIFNRGGLKKQFPARRQFDGYIWGTNPCGEILLRSKQFCNLSIAVVRPEDDLATIVDKVKTAAIWGTIQATMTNFQYLGPQWKKNVEEERLLGVDILGHMDSPLLKPGAKDLAKTLEHLRTVAVETNVEWAEKLGIAPAAAVTCGKPSGNSSQFFDCAAGFKPHHGQYYIRRFRATSNNPIAHMLRDAGVPVVKDYDGSGLVIEFPIKAPDNAILLGQMTAIEQLEHWKMYKVHYTEHNPSVSIYVRNDEWFSTGNWVYENWDIVGGLSFFPFDDSSYPLAPYETITEEEYDKRQSAIPVIDWSKLVLYETSDLTTSSQELACTGDACAL